MAWFSFVVCGENYTLKLEGSPVDLYGFYLTKFIEAETLEIAKVLVLDEVRNDEYLKRLIVDNDKSNSTLIIDKAFEHEQRPDHLLVELGDQPTDIYWEFFPMNEE